MHMASARNSVSINAPYLATNFDWESIVVTDDTALTLLRLWDFDLLSAERSCCLRRGDGSISRGTKLMKPTHAGLDVLRGHTNRNPYTNLDNIYSFEPIHWGFFFSANACKPIRMFSPLLNLSP